ncbi:hypothetical protein TREMEDRAFT_24881 [Tremella mesenterica DSM 1558]|uniref:uncharacterized protein n=1 Tax=Tremella mesenterica (strain ATCC 24925 / CBS 8224 / DSM 1558 / NBRC 9311 / NRRL Y-6157 / RJB 2259-6 / UBC 559-6) TaxID=578456 RepID=UPI0003F49E4E|nr:uncharacterized protein TREMEDRAFT_24881 [Tremella mesenterica DSM 1558]EIW72231.1 hypothetical protein TREMEDRAFT_24881 [Tremella mesenterica DSM 1558]
MSFSLSDPDFALILNGINQSPAKILPKSADSAETARPSLEQTVGTIPNGGTASPPESPLRESSSRSQQNLLTARNGPVNAEAGGSRSRSPSRSRLSPNDSVSPKYLRTRQPSAESTMSISSRLGPESSFSTLAEVLASAKHNGQETVHMDVTVLTAMLNEAEELKEKIAALNRKYTGAKRTSQQYSEGLTVAGEEYDKEVVLRRELEAEISRLRAQVHSQTARLSVISGDERRQENMRRRSNDLANNLTGLERDISRLRAQRDMTLAEVEELHAKRKSLDVPNEDAASLLGQSLTHRLDTIKEAYREELEPLTAQREALLREIAELRESREQFLEESAALSAKNEELAELNASLTRQADVLQDTIIRQRPTIFSKSSRGGLGHPAASPSMSSLTTAASTLHEVPEETARVVKASKPESIEAVPARRFKWYGYKSSKGPEASSASASISKPILLKNGNTQRPSTEFGMRDHQFSQHSTMRFTKCEVCGEKMWGLQEVKCQLCGVICHSKCGEKLPRSCPGIRPAQDNDGPIPPSMFGRDLIEQVQTDKTTVPVLVTKCIEAVEAVGMEYEGIYRKTGGSSQSKQITVLFERGDYDAFDLADVEAFNDVSSITSVLKTYFRSLPNPLLTHDLHESFVAAATIRDSHNKHGALCALLKELPKEHYATLKTLMLHLNRVTSYANVNLMTSQNLGVVFGPTLMRSSDPTREFGDMAGKALSVQWMIDNAPQVFTEA